MKQRPLNVKDAFRMLSRIFEKANKHPRGSVERAAVLDSALLAYLMVTRFPGVTLDRRKGRKRHQDDGAIMQKVAKATGETRPYTLAEIAIKTGAVDSKVERDSTKRRLVRAYRQMK